MTSTEALRIPEEGSTAPSTATTSRQGAIELRGVSKKYGDVTAVDDLDLNVEPGEFVTLLGPSGSGKTTTMMMVAGFENPTAGSILIDGAPVNLLPPKSRNLGVVFQSYALFPHMSAGDNVEFPLRMRRMERSERRRRAREALDRVGLSDLADRLPRQMSGGQQQRVALARALVFEPAALLLDEPMAALDRRLRETMQREIKEIQQALGISVIFVTHDQSEAMAMSDRIVVMRDGKIVQSGAPEEVYLHPQTDWIANFLGDTNLLPCKVKERRGDAATVDLGAHGVSEVKNRESTADGDLAVSIRPEHLTIGPLLGREANGISGTLLSSTHLGSTVRHEVRSEDTKVTVLQLSSDWDSTWRAGDAVHVSWRAEHAQLLELES
jgi:putative spermidine/putrescine transport system ATP-binding protein